MKTFGFQWHITDRCNQRCKHCYQEDFTSASELPAGRLYEVADRIFSGVPDREVSVNITGGEPLLHPHLFDLIDRMHGYPNLDEVNIITNGTIATDQVLGRIRSFPRIGVIKISLEAGEEGLNDRIRGAGNFGRVLAGIDRMVAGSGKPVVLMITLGAYNVGAIDGVVRLAREHGVSGVIFERFVPLGNGKSIISQALDRAGWERAVKSIALAADVDSEPADLLPYRAFWLWTDGRSGDVLDGALCNLGDESMAVMPDGTVYPCRRLPVFAGNVLAQPFAGILCGLERYSAGNMGKMLAGEHCGWCGVDDCAGCRALARALTGDMFADDPQCILNR